ncbi:hypothetical protein E4U14_005828 [Claviceps sp. LM454 group G7]|nr:hypothetical protein E4U14_005828 [Claviceps sp. LM454 group G7]
MPTFKSYSTPDYGNPDDLRSRPLDLTANWDAYVGKSEIAQGVHIDLPRLRDRGIKCGSLSQPRAMLTLPNDSRTLQLKQRAILNTFISILGARSTASSYAD